MAEATEGKNSDHHGICHAPSHNTCDTLKDGNMQAFSPTPPSWTDQAVHAFEFCCPSCHQSSLEANAAWINRRAPVYHEDYHRKWQEFYQCSCGTVWWAWSSDRPPSPLQISESL